MDDYVWKQTKTYERVKTRMKMDKNVWKMDENERLQMKTDENVFEYHNWYSEYHFCFSEYQ